jgi:hypothetical protein
MRESSWSVLGKDGNGSTPRALANFLRRYEIRPKNIRIMSQILKGYERQQFAEAWKRYPTPSEADETSLSSENSATAATLDNSAGQDHD